jgi:hypothetical protein
VTLVARWDSADDIGKPEKVTSFTCEACETTFSREEGEQLQATEADRVRSLEAARPDRQ